MPLCRGALRLPQRKDPGDQLRGACVHLHAGLCACALAATAGKICEALGCTDQFETAFAASREALGPGIGTRAASGQHIYL